MSHQRIKSGSPYEARYGFSRAVRIGDRVVVAGTAPIPPEGEQAAEGAYQQMMRCGEIAIAALAAAGAAPSHVVRTRMFITDAADGDEIGRAHNELFGSVAPAATMVVTQLLDPSWKVEIEVEAIVT